jgi:hypothetical protein
MVGSCEHSNESLDSTKDSEFLDYMSILLASQKMTLLYRVRQLSLLAMKWD